MAPPLSTPSSSRFLLSKRPSNQPQSQNPSQLAIGPQQFRATPRLLLPSTPRPSSNLGGAFTTPSALSGALRSSKARSAQDAIDSSPGSPPGSVASRDSPDPIELESSLVSQSPSRSPRDGPSPKRRRISISPDVEASSPPSEAGDDVLMLPGPGVESDGHDNDPSDDGYGHFGPDSSPAGRQGSDTDPHPPLLDRPRPQAPHPTFHKAPRFKIVAEDPASRPQHQYPLPDAFSPQRRGAKYVPGGLAAELRDWLVEVKGGGADGGDRDSATAVVTNNAAAMPIVEVDEVRPGLGMWLVKGRQRVRDGGGEGRFVDVRIILAGEGRLSGLARRSEVVGGCVVQISPPAWDIDLLDGSWSVACDWQVLEENG